MKRGERKWEKGGVKGEGGKGGRWREKGGQNKLEIFMGECEIVALLAQCLFSSAVPQLDTIIADNRTRSLLLVSILI